MTVARVHRNDRVAPTSTQALHMNARHADLQAKNRGVKGPGRWVTPLFAFKSTDCVHRGQEWQSWARLSTAWSPSLQHCQHCDPRLLMRPPPARHTYLSPPSLLLPTQVRGVEVARMIDSDRQA